LNTAFTIRTATPADNLLLSQLGHVTFDQAFAPFNTPKDMALYLSSAFSPELQATELQDERNVFWLVSVGLEVAGYVKLFAGSPGPGIRENKALKIARLYLRQQWWSQGIGRALLNLCMDYGREKGFAALWLTVWSENKGALKLYQETGFRIVGQEDFILGRDVQLDFIMEKQL
jgi:ribosomal protein S18 acetylase RimI-like enzyme